MPALLRRFVLDRRKVPAVRFLFVHGMIHGRGWRHLSRTLLRRGALILSIDLPWRLLIFHRFIHLVRPAGGCASIVRQPPHTRLGFRPLSSVTRRRVGNLLIRSIFSFGGHKRLLSAIEKTRPAHRP